MNLEDLRPRTSPRARWPTAQLQAVAKLERDYGDVREVGKPEFRESVATDFQVALLPEDVVVVAYDQCETEVFIVTAYGDVIDENADT